MTVNKITNAPTQNETIEKINEIIDNLGGGGTTEVFVATYGTTTRSEIYTARDNGLVCICIYNDKTYYLSRGAIFCETEVENGYVRIVYIDANEVWRSDNYPVVISVNNTRPTAGNVNISVPTKTSDLTNDSGYITGITSSDVTTALGYTPYDSSNPSGYTSNVGTVTSVNNVQPVNGNVTLSIPTKTSDLTNDSLFIENTAGTPTLANEAVGILGTVRSYGDVAIGSDSTCGQGNMFATAIGADAQALAEGAIQIGKGSNSISKSLGVGFGVDSNNNPLEYQLLDGTTGLIPDARISSNIARTSQIPAAQVNSDWNASSGVAEILNKPSLATVATSGSYTDLTNKPTIPSVITIDYSGV